MSKHSVISLVMILPLLALIGCGGRLYNVSPLPSDTTVDLPATGDNALIVGAEILGGDETLERFDANLPLAGVIAVEVQLANRMATAVNTNSLKFELRDESGKGLKRLDPKKALKRVMKYYGNGFYRLDARQQTIESYEGVSLPPNTSIAPQQQLGGFVFYETQFNRTSVSGLAFSAGSGVKLINVKIN